MYGYGEGGDGREGVKRGVTSVVLARDETSFPS